jgi:hypothetical protein
MKKVSTKLEKMGLRSVAKLGMHLTGILGIITLASTIQTKAATLSEIAAIEGWDAVEQWCQSAGLSLDRRAERIYTPGKLFLEPDGIEMDFAASAAAWFYADQQVAGSGLIQDSYNSGTREIGFGGANVELLERNFAYSDFIFTDSSSADGGTKRLVVEYVTKIDNTDDTYVHGGVVEYWNARHVAWTKLRNDGPAALAASQPGAMDEVKFAVRSRLADLSYTAEAGLTSSERTRMDLQSVRVWAYRGGEYRNINLLPSKTEIVQGPYFEGGVERARYLNTDSFDADRAKTDGLKAELKRVLTRQQWDYVQVSDY